MTRCWRSYHRDDDVSVDCVTVSAPDVQAEIESLLMSESASGPPDVVAIMTEIRRSIQEKRARGLYCTDEDVDAAQRRQLEAYAQECKIDPQIVQALLGDGHQWNLAADYPIRTHRPGVLPRVAILIKKITRPFIRLYTDALTKRQAQLNLYLVHLLHRSMRDGVRLEMELQVLRRRIQELEQKSSPPTQ